MTQSLAIVAYTAVIYALFIWIIRNDGRRGVGEESGPFRLRADGEDTEPDVSGKKSGSVRRQRRRRGPGRI